MPHLTPQRTCIVTRETRDQQDLLRFVIGPEDTLYFDLAGKLPGRGLYVRPDKETLTQALEKNRFSAAAKCKISVPQEMLRTVQNALKQGCLTHLALCKKAGVLAAGHEKCLTFIEKRTILAYVTSSEKEGDTRKKLQNKLKNAVLVDDFDCDELSAALGLDKVVHAVVAESKIGRKFLHMVELWRGLH